MTFVQKYRWLMPMLAFSGALIIARALLTMSLTFLFLPWNPFLGVVPLYCGFRLNITRKRSASWALLALWLLFFPNAMYVATDLFHLVDRPPVPKWYDLLILFSAALNGLLLGFLSLLQVEQYLRPRLTAANTRKVIALAFLLCGYGIYLGRYLRWNSWDIIANPFALLLDIKQDVVHPLRNSECWGLTTLFGAWGYIMYRYFRRVAYSRL